MKTVQFVMNVDTEKLSLWNHLRPKIVVCRSNEGDMTGLFGENYLTRGICLTKWPHPWGKLSTLLHAFYNPPGRPGVDPWGKPITCALVDDHCKICFITVVWCTDNSGWHTCLSLHVTGILWNLHCMRWWDKCTGVISCLWVSRLSLYYMMFWKQYCVVSVIGAI